MQMEKATEGKAIPNKAVEEKAAPEKTAGKAEMKKKEPQEEGKKKKQPAEPAYTARELADNAKNVFGARKECVAAALEAAGKRKCTVSEARMAVEKFLKKEVV